MQEADWLSQVEPWKKDKCTAGYSWIYSVRILPPSVQPSKAYFLLIWCGKEESFTFVKELWKAENFQKHWRELL